MEPKTKAAKDIKPGDWVMYGKLAFQVAEQWEADGFAFIMWPNMEISEYAPTERLTMYYDD